MKIFLKATLINLILMFVFIYGFEKVFLIKYLQNFINVSNNIGNINTGSLSYSKKECTNPLKYSFVDTRSPGLLRDKIFGHFLTPNLTSVNNNGFLFDCFEQKNENDYNVILIGDSFTASIQVPISKTWPNLLRKALLEKYPDKVIRIYNMAVGGAGVLHQIKQLKYAINKMKPDLILHSLYLGNDFTDEDFESFQLTQKPHRQFSPTEFKVLKKNEFVSIKPNINYYLMMNLVQALNNNGMTIRNKLGNFDFNVDWNWNNSRDLDKRFKLTLNHNGISYPLKSVTFNPIKSFIAKDIAIKFEFQIEKKSLIFEILRSTNYIANQNKIIFARTCYSYTYKCSEISHFFDPKKKNNNVFTYDLSHKKMDEKFKSKQNKKDNLNDLKTEISNEQKYRYPFAATFEMISILVNRNKKTTLDRLTLEKPRLDTIDNMPRPYMIYVDEDHWFMKDRKKIFIDNFKSIFEITDSINYHLFTIPSMLSASEKYWDYANLDKLSTFKISRFKPELTAKQIFKDNSLAHDSFFDFINDNHLDATSLYDPIHRHFTVHGHKKYFSFLYKNLNK